MLRTDNFSPNNVLQYSKEIFSQKEVILAQKIHTVEKGYVPIAHKCNLYSVLYFIRTLLGQYRYDITCQRYILHLLCIIYKYVTCIPVLYV